MRKITLLVLVAICANALYGQVLYSISGNGLKKESYIVGTHHLVDYRFMVKIPGIEGALKKSKQVYGELKMGDMANPDTIKMMQQAMMLPEGTTIKDVLGTEYFGKLNELFMNISGVPFDHPQIYETMGKMKPSALESQLTILLYIKSHPGEFDPTNGLDSYFQQEALKSKKKVGGLESYAFQLKMIYNSKSLEEEAKDLMCMLDNIGTAKEQLEILTEAYASQNAEELYKVLQMAEEGVCAENNFDELLYQRNADWVAKMPAIMKKNPTLFVVGAGHLFGDKGVLEMLRNAGYTITAVTK